MAPHRSVLSSASGWDESAAVGPHILECELDLEFTPEPHDQSHEPAHPPRTSLFDVFAGEHGLRAGWRLTLYVALVVLLTFLSGFVASLFPQLFRGNTGMGAFFFQEIGGFVVVSAAALFMARLEGRSPGVFGLPLRGAFGEKFWMGAIFGLGEISLLIGAIALAGGYSFGPLALGTRDLLLWALVWTVFFLFVGLFEEFLFRGYAQFTLADGIGFWPAAILLSLAFGAIHLRNPGEDWLGAASVAATGLLFALVLRRTGNLWMAVGWHASFDFGETFLFSVPNSGAQFRGHLSAATLHGPTWLTGGAPGPEASIFSFIVLGLAAFAVHKLYPRANATG